MKLSPSALQDFKRCARCFWLARLKGIKQPRGIYPSLPGKMDELLKAHYDKWRVRGELPPEVRGLLPGLLYTPLEDLARWREWDTGLVATNDDLQISGMVDDTLVGEDGKLAVLDYKTKGDPPHDGYSAMYYQVAGDCYDVMLATVRETVHKAFFVYYFPTRVSSTERGLVDAPMNTVVQQIDALPERAWELAREAKSCLSGAMPASAQGCEMCLFVARRATYEAPASALRSKGKGKR